MKRTWNFLFITALSALLLALLGACTNIRFEHPVPQKGNAMRQFPADWAGTYVAEPAGQESTSVFEQIFRPCYRFERLDDDRLLVSTEMRVHEQDLPRLRKALEDEKKGGKLLDYQLAGGFILCTLKVDEADQNSPVEQQFTPLIKQGPWYILTQTIAPFRLYDLKAGVQQEFDQKAHAGLKTEWLPGSDSLAAKQFRLAAREMRNSYYLNTQEADDDNWALLYVTQPAKDQLLVKISNVEDMDAFEQRLDHFNTITPFRKKDDNFYLIDPTDQALGQLLAEEHLFQTTVLRKIE